MGLHKIIKIIALIISLIGIAFLGMMILKGDDVIKETGAGIDGFIYTSYFIFALVLMAVIIFGFKGLMSGNIKNTLIVLGVSVAVVAVSYVLADGTPMELNDGGMLSESDSKWVGAGLYAFYILGAAAIASMILSGFKKAK